MPERLKAMGLVVCTICALGPSNASAAMIQVVSAASEYAAAHPKAAPRAQPTAASSGDFQAVMDQVFGQGRWRQTSGYRTTEQEDALRRQGAGTVAAGRISRHSIGGADAPGAYDAVVDRMPLGTAAARLRSAGAPFSRVMAESAHGGQGAHLHIELASAGAGSAGVAGN